MFNARSKIIKKDDVSSTPTLAPIYGFNINLQSKPTDLEDEVAKALYQFEMNNANLKEHMAQVYINSAELIEYQQQDGHTSKTLFVKVPFRSITFFHKVSEKVVLHLEQKFSWPVIVIASRNIISKRGKQPAFHFRRIRHSFPLNHLLISFSYSD